VCARIAFLVFLCVSGLSGCASTDDAPVARVPSDLSGPKPAALTFLRAIAAGDARTAQDASLGTPDQKEWGVAMAALVRGLRRYDQAILARFGTEAVPTDVDLRQAIQSMTQDPITHIQDGILSESAESAVIYPAALGIKLAAHPPMMLRKDKSTWKVDLSAMSGEPSHDPAVIRQYRAAAKALSDVARQVRAGRYKSLAEAQQSVGSEIDIGQPE
jgi:hypothetical protein